jgi:hypothetical protein
MYYLAKESYVISIGDLLNELSNDGAREQFKKYLELDILPLMVQAAKVLQVCVSSNLFASAFECK